MKAARLIPIPVSMCLLSERKCNFQDEFQKNEITFVMNRKFPKETVDLSMVMTSLLI
jgi:hypothetical protein